MKLLLVDERPAPAYVAPFIELVLRRAGQTATSIYRGDDAAALLHAHGLHTQREIYDDPAYAGKANPPGRSQHELRSDGLANAGPVGRVLEPWQVGIDSGADSAEAKLAISRAARYYGWRVEHPYSRGVEGHHWCFAHRPVAHGLRMKLRVIRVRRGLARR